MIQTRFVCRDLVLSFEEIKQAQVQCPTRSRVEIYCFALIFLLLGFGVVKQDEENPKLEFRQTVVDLWPSLNKNINRCGEIKSKNDRSCQCKLNCDYFKKTDGSELSRSVSLLCQ